jgi:BirA family biotin operon repressor/biotin-[acetyl-CoA-carboxylase] ligase
LEVSATIISNRNGYKLFELLSVDSTNNYAAKLSNEQLVSGYSVIMAHNQTDGRGQRGSLWEAEPSKNLTCSVVYNQINIPVSNQFIISMAVALSIYDTLRWVVKNSVQLKWPNDIYVGANKLGGILIENNLVGNNINKVIIGVGLNVNQKVFPEHINATSLINELGEEINLIELLDQWIPNLKNRLNQLNFEKLKADYLKCLLWKGITQAFDYKAEIIDATITDVTSSGHLVLVTTGGRRIEADLKEIKRL